MPNRKTLKHKTSKRKTSKRKTSKRSKPKGIVPKYNQYQINHLKKLTNTLKQQDEEISLLLKEYESLLNEFGLDKGDYEDMKEEHLILCK